MNLVSGEILEVLSEDGLPVGQDPGPWSDQKNSNRTPDGRGPR